MPKIPKIPKIPKLTIFVCMIMVLTFYNVSQQWKISNYSDTITHLAKNLEYTRNILNKANEKISNYSDKISNYSDKISNLTKKLEYTKDRLNKSDDKIFALGKNLVNNKYSYDIKFIIITDDMEFEFFAHKYILKINSEYFEQLFGNNSIDNNSIDNITYYDITENEFNSFLELLYFGQFNTNVKLENYENIVKYTNKYLILEKYKNYMETYFSEKINDNIEMDNMELISHVYNISRVNNLDSLQTKILAGIYNKWKCNSDGEYLNIINYPTILYDYINFINCGENNIKMLTS